MKAKRVIPQVGMLVLATSLSIDNSTARSANGDTTGASLLGSPPDVISVDPTQGAAGMGLPFEVPPGRAGLQPQLALSYSSGSSEPGAFGRGWTLALPSIRRSTRFGQPQFDWTDTFALHWNGGANDLVLVFDGTVGGVGIREFRTLIETFMRIRSFTDPGGFTHWELWDGAGRRYEFGNPGTDASPTQAGDFLWALNRVEDSHGNYMTVDWLLDAGTLYPLIIRYTGKVGGPGPSNRVEFAYEGRYDVIGQRLGVKAGAAQREVRYRLRRVKTFAGSDVASVYLLEYTTPGTGELTSDLCAGVSCGLSSWFCGGTGMTATCPNTCDSQTGFCVACTPNCCGECATITTTCPNGGFAACVQECNPSYGCLQCTPNCNPGGGGGGGGCPGCPPMPESPMPMAGAQSPVDYGPSLLASVQRSNNTGSAHLPSIRFTYTADQSAQKLWTLSANLLPVAFLSKADTAQARSTFDYGVQMEDVNGDALPDLLMGLGYTCSGAPPRKVYLNRGASWVEALAGTWELPADFVMRDCDHGQYDSGLRLVDVNGDHRPDLVRSYTWNGGSQTTTVWINEYGTWIGPKPAADWNVPVPFVAIETSGASGIQSKDLGVRFADVDGDGWTDLVRGRNGTRDVYLNNRGAGWDSATSGGWHPPVDFVYHYPGGDVDVGARLLDLNGDGLADIIQSTLRDGVPTKRVWIGRGRAGLDGEVWQLVSGWDIPQYFSVVNGSNDDSDDLGVRLADVNGDGRVDLIVARRWEGTSTSCTTFGTWGGSTCQTVYLQHAGQGWVEDLEWSSAIPPGYFFIEHKQDYEDYDDGVRVADVDGNGTVDFLRGLDGWGGGPREWRKNADQFSELLASVDNGVGGTSILSYQSSAYTNHTTGTPSTRSMDLVFPLVNQVVTSDGQTGTGHTYTTIYSYLSGYYHAPRREFRGFATVQQSLSGSDRTMFRYNLLEESRDVAPLAGVTWRVLLTSSAAWRYELIRTFDTSHSGPTHFHYLTGTTETFWDYPTGSPPISRTLRVDYLTTLAQEGDPFVLSRTVRRYGATQSEDLDVTEEYLNDTTNWRIGLVGRRYTADFHANPTTPLTQTWFYYDDPDWGEVGATGDLTQIEGWSGNAADGPGADGNRVSTMDYDDYGNIIATVDPEQHASTIEYETDNHTYPMQTTVETDDGTGPVSHISTYSYDPRFGVQTEATTPGDGAVSYRYDSFGRIVKSWNALDSEALPTACFEYDFGPPAIRATTYRREFSGGGSSCGVNGMLATSTFHDGLGRFLQAQSEGDAPSTVEVAGRAAYDGEGNVESVTLPYRTGGTVFYPAAPPAGTAKTSFLYDPLDRKTQTTLPGGPSTRFVINKYLGWTVQSFDPQNYKTEVDFDPFGRVRKRRTYRKPVDGGGLYAEVSMDYDRLGRLWRITDPGGNHIEHQYNAFGERRETLDPDVGPIPTEFDYHKDGLLKTLTTPTGQETTYAYDALHRVLREDHADGTGARYHYDEAAGRPPGAAQPKGHLTSVDGLTTGIRQEMKYDTIGRLSGVTETVDGQPKSIGFAYDALSRLVTLTYPDGSGVVYTYKPSGRTAGVWGPTGMSATDTAYTPWGALSHVRYGNGLDVTHDFDQAAAWLNGLRACVNCGQGNEVQVVDATFGRDLSGHVTSILDGVNGDNQNFVLDHLYRVETATAPAPAGYGSLTFQHDVLGNLRQKDNITYDHSVAGMPHRLSGASDGRTFQYDGHGSLEWMVFPSGGTRHYVYDARQQLASVTDSASGVQTLNVFNPSGQRVKRTVVQGGNATTTRFLSSLYEESATGTRKFIYLEGRRIAEVHGASEVFYLVNDQVGSLQAVMGPNGSPVRVRYKPFGEVFGVEGQGFSMAFGFASSRHDEAQGLEDFGARFYDPALGRFLSVDPLLLDPLNLMDQNPYGYARGNPVSFVDVGGLAADDCPADFCLSTPPSNPPQGGQSTTVSFKWEGGKIDLSGLWGSLKRPFSRAWDHLQDGYYGLRDGVRGIDLGGGGVDEGGSFSGAGGGPGSRLSPAAGGHTSNHNDTGPWTLGWQWLSGSGRRDHEFHDGDPMTRMLQAHPHMSEVRNQVADAVAYGGRLSDRKDYELSGPQGIPKYVRDYSTLATGGLTGNLAVAYLGGYNLEYQVLTIDHLSGTALVGFHAWNVSDVESLLHAPVVGYTDWWHTNIGGPINSHFSTGPLSPTTQDFRWSETIVWR